MPFDPIEMLPPVAGTVNTAGTAVIIAAPGAAYGTIARIRIAALSMQNEGTAAVTITLQAGSVQYWRYRGQSQGSGVALSFSSGREIVFPLNTAVSIAIDSSTPVGYSILYWAETT